jgi:phosphatidylglycerophosphate synthase
VIDQRLREAKDRAIDPVVRGLVALRVGAGWFTAAGLITSLAAGALAWRGLTWWALAAFLAGRVFDSVDGAVARRAGTASDLGGYLDQLADTVGYALVPLGLAAGIGTTEVWAACAVLVASFYVNIVSWAYLAALAEKRGAGAAAQGSATSIVMPTGLVEGAETVVLYAAMLAFPGWLPGWFWLMAVLVAVTVAQRVAWAVRELR